MDSNSIGTVARLIGIGWYVASCIGVGAVVGFWADKSLGTSPFFSVIGTLIGVAASVLGMFKMLMSVLKSTK
tara:strand:- start:785 stop:1000 length:216 start_codon:yes stop_codon:yes gene_type:complete